jgi:hypothetical protein
LNTSPPANVKEVRQLLGLTGYFRKFLKDYSHTVKPVSDLLNKRSPF